MLTGTPIQNNLHEMWSLYDYACPGLLGSSRDFKREYENPIKAGSHKKATQREVELGTALAAKLREVIDPHFLRREKAVVFKQDEGTPTTSSTPISSKRKKKTPKSGGKKKKLTLNCHKNDFIVWVKLSETQRNLYRDFLGSDTVKEMLNSTKSPLAALTVLKKICNHPLLLHQKMSTLGNMALPSYLPASFDSSFFGAKGESPSSESPFSSDSSSCSSPDSSSSTTSSSSECSAAPPPSPSRTKEEETEFLLSLSGKLGFLARLLVQLKKENQRVVVFSLSVRTLDMIDAVLRHLNLSRLRIDGSVRKPSERQERIDRFNNNPDEHFCFLLTTQVGGVGISLTSATRVVVFDPSWNTIDDQAVDRVYRLVFGFGFGFELGFWFWFWFWFWLLFIVVVCFDFLSYSLPFRLGQTKDVIVYRLITCGTIEEKIYRKQVFKGSLMKKVMEKKDPFRYFTSQELRDIMTLDNPDFSATQVFFFFFFLVSCFFFSFFFFFFFFFFFSFFFPQPLLGPTRRNARFPKTNNPPTRKAFGMVATKQKKRGGKKERCLG